MDGENYDMLWGPKTLEASEYVIDDYLEQVRSYTFTYDFGDDWKYLVQIEKVLENYEKNYPEVIKYKGDLPAEDCGGVWGYQELKEHLAEPDSPEYEGKKGFNRSSLLHAALIHVQILLYCV